LFAAGDLGSKPDQQYKTLEIKDAARDVYRKAYFSNSQLCGVVLIGDISKMRELIVAMKEQKSFADAAALFV
jgi:NAD(P)H-nitrite reductase large subunit